VPVHGAIYNTCITLKTFASRRNGILNRYFESVCEISFPGSKSQNLTLLTLTHFCQKRRRLRRRLRFSQKCVSGSDFWTQAPTLFTKVCVRF